MSDRDLVPDRRALGDVIKDKRLLLAFEGLFRQALETTPGDLAASFLYPNFVAAFSGVGDSITNNDTAFTDAEASDYEWIYLPEGEFVSTLAQGLFTKHYVGPGKIVLPGATMPGRFSYMATTPTLWPTQGATGFFRGDTSQVDPEWRVIGPGTRAYVGARYFEAAFINHPVWLDVYSGASGWLSGVVGALAIGATSLTLTSVDGVVVGGVYGLATAMSGTCTDTITVDTIVGVTITFHPALTVNYATAVLMDGNRTWNGVRYSKVTNYGAAGDVYGDIARLIQSYQPKAGQTHFFETSTVGQYGGDVNFTTSGTYGTGWESSYADQGNDVAVIAQVDTFTRDNDTGARSVVWMGNYFKSDGAKPADVAHAVAGKWRVGLDTVKADLSTFVTAADGLNCAINTALGHRWIMNSTALDANRGGSTKWGTFYGNTPGDMYVESGNDGVTDFIALRFDRAAPNDGRIRLRPNGVQINKSVSITGSLLATGDLLAGPGGLIATNGSGSGDYIFANAAGGWWEFYIGGVLVGTIP